MPEPAPEDEADDSKTSAQAAPANEPQEPQDNPPADPDPAPAEAAAVVTVNSPMFEQVQPSGDMREHLDEGGETAVRSLIGWLEAGAKEEDFEKAGLVQEGDPSAKEVIADCCISCHNADGGDNEELPYAETEDSEPQYNLISVSTKPKVAEAEPETKTETEMEAEPAAEEPAAAEETAAAESEAETKKPEPKHSTKRLIHITHAHILAIPVFTFVVGALFMFTGFGPGVKLVLGPLPMLAVLLDIGSWWAARWCEPFIFVIAGAGALFGITYALQILCILCSVWCGRKDDTAAA